MRRILAPLAALLTALVAAPPALAAPARATAVTATTVFTTGTQVVAGMAFDPGGRLFYVGPNSGQVFLWTPSTRRTTTFAAVTGAVGLFGVTVSPTFATDHYVYAYAAVARPSGQHEVLVRWTAANGVGTAFQVLRDVGPRGTDHTGGKLLFSPDGKDLFLVVGDAEDPATSQDLSVDHGKVLRMTPLGRAAVGNPGFPDKAVWAYGIRNSIGMTFDPVSGRLWETENGPQCNDEINLIAAGSNHGWGPSEVCDGTVRGTNQDGPSPVLPARNFATVVAPTGLTACRGCGLAGAEGTLVYGRYLKDDLRRLTLDATRTKVLRDDLLYQDSSSVLAVETNPRDGSIWFADKGHALKRLS